MAAITEMSLYVRVYSCACIQLFVWLAHVRFIFSSEKRKNAEDM